MLYRYLSNIFYRCKESFSRELAVKMASSSPQSYQDAFGQVCGVLNVSFDISLEELAEKFGASQCMDIASANLAHFKKHLEARLQPAQRDGLKYIPTLLNCCALWLACELFNVPLDKFKLIEPTSISLSQFESSLRQMKEFTTKLVKPSEDAPSGSSETEILGNAPPKKKVKSASGAAIATTSKQTTQLDLQERPKFTLDMPIVDKQIAEMLKAEDTLYIEKLMKVSILSTPAVSMVSQSMAEKRKEDDERYREWRNTTAEAALKARAAAPSNGPQKPKKQTKISFAKASSSKSSS
jgi:hypothetical protein